MSDIRGYFKEEDWDIEEGYTSYDYEDAHVVVKLPNDNYLDADGEISEQELIDLCNWSYPVKLGKTNENGKFIEEIKLVLTELEAFNIFYGFDEQEHIKDEDEQ